MALLLFLVVQGSTARDSFHLVTQPAQRVAATLSVKIDAPSLNTTEWVFLAARPPDLPYQTDVTTGMTPQGKPTRDLTDLKRPMLIARLPARTAAQRRETQVKLTVQASLHSRRLISGTAPRSAKSPLLSAQERQLALGVNTLVDHQNAEFRDWLAESQLQKAPAERDLDFARRVFTFLRGHCGYEFKENQERRASVVCKTGQSDCGGHAALFVATLRANGVPARVLIGRWATSSKPDAKLEGLAYTQTHVKAEFFAEGIGWTPVDLSQAVTDKREHADPMAYFGNDPGDFLVFHIDHDLKVNSIHFGVKTIDGLQGIQYYAPGPGTFDGCTTKETWDVRRLSPAGARR
jgi:hypothetical protein